MIRDRFGPLLAATLLAASAPAWAQTPTGHDHGHAGGGAEKMQGGPAIAAPPAGSKATVSYTHLTPVSYTHLTLPTTPYV